MIIILSENHKRRDNQADNVYGSEINFQHVIFISSQYFHIVTFVKCYPIFILMMTYTYKMFVW